MGPFDTEEIHFAWRQQASEKLASDAKSSTSLDVLNSTVHGRYYSSNKPLYLCPVSPILFEGQMSPKRPTHKTSGSELIWHHLVMMRTEGVASTSRISAPVAQAGPHWHRWQRCAQKHQSRRRSHRCRAHSRLHIVAQQPMLAPRQANPVLAFDTILKGLVSS